MSSASNVASAQSLVPSTYRANGKLTAGSLMGDGSVTGDVILEASKGGHRTELNWQPGFINGIGAPWLLGL
ncbi:MAG TPA: hypothetical protein VGS80_13220 [Ktedonobacterales bacterium]|nr:hypothetical protein [Ktedonobacterales bacterium]